MAAFTELDWMRMDVHAIVGSSGLAVIEEARHSACRAWIERHDYRIATLDCRGGLGIAIPELGRMLEWEANFGYVLEPGNCNLNALNDGFEFDASETGCVLEILGADIAWQEDVHWMLGLLSISTFHSRVHLAQGERFFVLLVLPVGSTLINVVVDEIRVPVIQRCLSPREYHFLD